MVRVDSIQKARRAFCAMLHVNVSIAHVLLTRSFQLIRGFFAKEDEMSNKVTRAVKVMFPEEISKRAHQGDSANKRDGWKHAHFSNGTHAGKTVHAVDGRE